MILWFILHVIITRITVFSICTGNNPLGAITELTSGNISPDRSEKKAVFIELIMVLRGGKLKQYY